MFVLPFVARNYTIKLGGKTKEGEKKMRMIMFLAAMAATCAMAIPLDLRLPTWSELTRAGRPVKTMNVVATVRPVKIDGRTQWCCIFK